MAPRKYEQYWLILFVFFFFILTVVEPDSGLLKGHSEQIIKISVFNDISGKVLDTLDLDVEGLETKEIPVSIHIEGSPVVLTAY